MNCPTCNLINVEVSAVHFNGKTSVVLANFCAKCGMDLRPYHDEMMKHSDLKPAPLSLSQDLIDVSV